MSDSLLGERLTIPGKIIGRNVRRIKAAGKGKIGALPERDSEVPPFGRVPMSECWNNGVLKTAYTGVFDPAESFGGTGMSRLWRREH